MVKSIYTLFLVAGILLQAAAQQPGQQKVEAADSLGYLRLEEAVMLALEHNPNIIVARKQADIRANEATIGNAGLLPSLSLNGSYSVGYKDTRLEFGPTSNQPDSSGGQGGGQGGGGGVAREPSGISAENARNEIYQAAATLSYTLFGGFERYYQFSSLKSGKKIGQLQARLTAENTILQLLQSYTEVARLAENLQATEEAVQISLQRYRRAQARYEFGAATKLEILQAKVDLNSDSTNLVQMQNSLAKSRRNLAVLMGTDPQSSFEVEHEFALDKNISLPFLLENATENNANLILVRQQRENSYHQLRAARAGHFPRLDLNLSYEYNRVENEASFIEFQRTNGPAGTVSLSYPIFNGGRQNILEQNAEIRLASQEESIRQRRLEVKRNVLNAYEDYQQSLLLLRLSDDDLETALLAFERAREAWQTGQLNSTEFRESQLNLLRSRIRISEQEIQAKRAEMELYRLAGLLIRELKEER